MIGRLRKTYCKKGLRIMRFVFVFPEKEEIKKQGRARKMLVWRI